MTSSWTDFWCNSYNIIEFDFHKVLAIVYNNKAFDMRLVIIFIFLWCGQGSREPPNKGHFWTSHFVLRWEVVLFSEVKNELLLWERGPELHPLLGGCPYLGRSFIRGSTVLQKHLDFIFGGLTDGTSLNSNIDVLQYPAYINEILNN